MSPTLPLHVICDEQRCAVLTVSPDGLWLTLETGSVVSEMSNRDGLEMVSHLLRLDTLEHIDVQAHPEVSDLWAGDTWQLDNAQALVCAALSDYTGQNAAPMLSASGAQVVSMQT